MNIYPFSLYVVLSSLSQSNLRLTFYIFYAFYLLHLQGIGLPDLFMGWFYISFPCEIPKQISMSYEMLSELHIC